MSGVGEHYRVRKAPRGVVGGASGWSEGGEKPRGWLPHRAGFNSANFFEPVKKLRTLEKLTGVDGFLGVEALRSKFKPLSPESRRLPLTNSTAAEVLWPEVRGCGNF